MDMNHNNLQTTASEKHTYMNKRLNLHACLIVVIIAAGYLSVMYLGCRIWPLNFVDCADSFQSFHLILFAPAGLAFTMVSLDTFYKNKESRKTALISTGIVATVIGLASFAMSQYAPVTHDAAIFCLTMLIVWVSLLINRSLRKALLSWAIATVFLSTVMVAFPDGQVLISLLYVMFSGGVALYATGVSKLAEYVGVIIVGMILVLVCVMAHMAVVELGPIPPGYEWLLVNSLFHNSPTSR